MFLIHVYEVIALQCELKKFPLCFDRLVREFSSRRDVSVGGRWMIMYDY